MSVPLIIGPKTREKAAAWVRHAPDGTAVVFHQSGKRTLEQNALLHALLTDISRQVVWHGRKLTMDAWKDVLGAALLTAKHRLEVVPGIDGGFVMVGLHTADLLKDEFGELLELVLAFGAEHGVQWTEPASRDAAAKSAPASLDRNRRAG